ncbi:MAG: DUF4239 domain-containing protein [Bacteroidetes bacterium]|nr:DUF4239 domain-containing protein [Bacteroidota bacterium]
MLYLVSALPGWLLWLIIFALLSGFSLLGLSFLRRKLPETLLAKSHDVAGFYISILGVLYAVILAYGVIAVWEDYADAEKNLQKEASAIADIYRGSLAFGNPFKDELKNHLRNYTNAVINDEWKELGFRKNESGEAMHNYNALHYHINQFNPVSEREKIAYANILIHLNTLSEAKRTRLQDSKSSMEYVVCAVFWSFYDNGFYFIFQGRKF